MKKNLLFRSSVFFFLFAILVFSCINNPAKEKSSSVKPENNKQVPTKPPGNYHDTLKIDFPAAVFYHPDSLQLEKIKSVTDARIFDGSMHEYFFLMRNAQFVIKKSFPQLKIIEAKNIRYLLFVSADKTRVCIDLDTKNDVYGLFGFDRQKLPRLLDMANIDSELGFYLKE